MYSGALLKSGSLRDFTALGGVGHPVYAAADQIRTAVAHQIGRDAADLLAIPKVDAETRNVDWYSPIEGDIVPWSAASPEERDTARKRLGELNSKIEAHARQVVYNPKSNDHLVFGRLLALSTRIPDTSHIFIIKGQPVLSFWGFVPAGADASRHVIADLLREAAAEAPKPSGPVPPPSPSPGIATSGGPAVATMAEERGPWMRWLWLLPLLLLLLLLAGALRSCGYVTWPIPYVGDNGVVVPGWTDNTQGVVNVPSGNAEVTVPPGVVTDTSNGVVTVPTDQVPADQVPVTNDQTTADDTSNDQQTVIPPADGTSGPDTANQPNPPQPDDTNSADSNTADTGQDQSHPPSPDTNQQSSKTDSETGQASNSPNSADSNAPIKPVEIPSASTANGPADFMQGKWRSQTSLRAQKDSSEPVRIGYQFNKQGQGTTTLYLNNGVNCSGPSTASVQKGILKIQDQSDLKCTDGKSFQGSTVECSKVNGHTSCVGHYPNGRTYYIVLGQ